MEYRVLNGKRDAARMQFAELAAAAIEGSYPELTSTGESARQFLQPESLYHSIERPKEFAHGDFALPLFTLSKLLRRPPAAISDTVAQTATGALSSGSYAYLGAVVSLRGYLNVTLDPSRRAEEVITAIARGGSNVNLPIADEPRTILVEYSSPNIAKPFGVGHLRSTVIGNSLRRIYRALGYSVTGINYLGDWGTQFGKMIVAFQKWGNESAYAADPIRALYDLYVRFHKEAETDPALEQAARVAFRRLENGDPEMTPLWERFRALSLEDFHRVYNRLGVEFDLVFGEAFFNDKMDAVVDRFTRTGLTELSDGALIVRLDDPQLPPCLLRRTDGATLYATRDIAGMVWRWNTYHFDESLYIVGSAQADHFRQCLGAVSRLEEAERIPASERMVTRIHHVDFGWIRFGDKTMSTRQGNIVILDEVIDRAVALVRERMTGKYDDHRKLHDISEAVGTGAVIFSQLAVRRQKDVNFVWDQVLSFEGETGPYLQYTHARLCSLERHYGKGYPTVVDWKRLIGTEERAVIAELASFPDAVSSAAEQYEPFFVADYLLRLAGAFNSFYQRKDAAGRIDKVLSDDTELTDARMALVVSVRKIMAKGLELLGLKAPEEM